jgi:membrane protease subunit (stomatin/prohibitin family)
MMRDPEFGPVRVRAFGTYAMHVRNPGTFLKQLVATDPSFETWEIANQLRNTIVSRFVDALGQAKIAVLDLAGNYDKISQVALERIRPDLETMGLALTTFYIENISLPPEVEQALDKRTQMGVLGNLDQYAKFQTAEAIRDAAQNPGGIAGIGAGLGAGVAVAQQMGSAISGAATAPAAVTAAPPPLPGAVQFHAAINGTQAGPFGLDAFAAKLREGAITRDTLVWKPGMAGWIAAGQVPELQALFAAAPPPLPR